MDHDYIELGDTGWIPQPDGTFVNYKEGLIRTEDGSIISIDGIDISNDDYRDEEEYQ